MRSNKLADRYPRKFTPIERDAGVYDVGCLRIEHSPA